MVGAVLLGVIPMEELGRPLPSRTFDGNGTTLTGRWTGLCGRSVGSRRPLVWRGFDRWLDDGRPDPMLSHRQGSPDVSLVNGRWSGCYDLEPGGANGAWQEPKDWDGWGRDDSQRGRPSEKIQVPSFGECSNEQELGRSARS